MRTNQNEKQRNCCICGTLVNGYGHNPQGAMWKDGEGNICEPQYNIGERCCDNCNVRYVIPGRLELLKRWRNNQQ